MVMNEQNEEILSRLNSKITQMKMNEERYLDQI